jgi:hypothetical protein
MMIFINPSLSGASRFIISLYTERAGLTAMEALDLVKEQYANNFEKVFTEEDTVNNSEAAATGAEISESGEGRGEVGEAAISESETGGTGITTDKTDRSEAAKSEISEEVYFYKLPSAEYYLVYEGKGDTEYTFIIHLYEYVLDEPDLNLGHTVTYGWYTVDKWTGKITEITD